jgi:hypothetical protein
MKERPTFREEIVAELSTALTKVLQSVPAEQKASLVLVTISRLAGDDETHTDVIPVCADDPEQFARGLAGMIDESETEGYFESHR